MQKAESLLALSPNSLIVLLCYWRYCVVVNIAISHYLRFCNAIRIAILHYLRFCNAVRVAILHYLRFCNAVRVAKLHYLRFCESCSVTSWVFYTNGNPCSLLMDDVLDDVELFGAERLGIEHAEVVLELGDAADTDDDGSDFGTTQTPGEGHVG